jgi:hypothetical protein
VVTAEAVRLGNKAEQPLRIATREYRHSRPKDMTNVTWTQAGRAPILGEKGGLPKEEL